MDSTKGIQVSDDPTLLEQMLFDIEKADVLYKPTNYWKEYEKIFLKELKKLGLHDFRRRRFTILESFNATDTLLRGLLVARTRFRGAGRLAQLLSRALWNNTFFPLVGLTSGRAEDLVYYFYQHVRKKFALRGYCLNNCPTSVYGNPEDIAEIDGRHFSMLHLNYCSMVADAAPHISFSDRMVFCELGAGLGRNIEVLAQLFPNATFIIFDIPPQLYVSNQYLRAVFEERVVPYREATCLTPDGSDRFLRSIAGKIVVLPTFRLPAWSRTNIDIFWNSASFQEMEPDVVLNYLHLVKQMHPRHIYINALPGGNYWGEWKPGQGGTKEPVTDSYYSMALQNTYQLVAEYDTEYFLRAYTYKSYIYNSIDADT